MFTKRGDASLYSLSPDTGAALFASTPLKQGSNREIGVEPKYATTRSMPDMARATGHSSFLHTRIPMTLARPGRLGLRLGSVPHSRRAIAWGRYCERAALVCCATGDIFLNKDVQMILSCVVRARERSRPRRSSPKIGSTPLEESGWWIRRYPPPRLTVVSLSAVLLPQLSVGHLRRVFRCNYPRLP